MQTHEKAGPSEGQQREEVSSISFLFPEERLYSTNHSNKLPTIRLAIYSLHSGSPFLKGPVLSDTIYEIFSDVFFWQSCPLPLIC